MVKLRTVITEAINSVSADGLVVEHTTEEMIDEVMASLILAGVPLNFQPFEEESAAKEELEDRVRSIYMNGLGEEFNFYAGQADETGLVAVYNAGVAAGKKEKN